MCKLSDSFFRIGSESNLIKIFWKNQEPPMGLKNPQIEIQIFFGFVWYWGIIPKFLCILVLTPPLQVVSRVFQGSYIKEVRGALP